MKYITQKDILKHFRDTDNDEFSVFISFVGYYVVNGYHSRSSSFDILEPQKITFKYDRDALMSIIAFREIDEPIPEDTGDVMSRMFTPNPNNNPLYPLNHETISDFNSHIQAFDDEDNKIEWDGEIIDSIKFFKTLDEAELNFALMLRNYLEKSNLIQALSTYDRILDKHTITNPSDLLKNI